MRQNIIRFCYLGLILLFLFISTGCKNEEDKGNDESNDVIINLLEDKITLKVGESHKINVEIQNGSGSCTYYVGDKNIISINNDVILGLSGGRTTVLIEVICDDNTKKELTLTVEVLEEKEYTITFGANCEGFYREEKKIKRGDRLVLGDAPEIEGFEFLGWRLDNDNFITEISDVEKDIKVFAIYGIRECDIKYSLRGGTYDGISKANYGDFVTFGKPTKDGYVFIGWTLERDSEDYVKKVEIKSDITLYAHWEVRKVYPEGEYPIYYDLNGGSWNVLYYTPQEIAAEFLADFKASSGKTIEPERFDCAYIESSWFGDMMQNKEYLNKWMWLLDAIWEVARGTSSQKAATADFSDLNVKGFYITYL